MTALSDTIEKVQALTIKSEDPFSTLRDAAKLIGEFGSDNPDAIQLTIWLLQKRQILAEHDKMYGGIVDDICREVGLFPYIADRVSDWRDLFAVSAFATPADVKFTFHKKQAEVFWRLMRGESIALSAPTSFGKSAIVDTLIELKGYQRVAIIVPTIALLDETRRRLTARFGDRYQVISHKTQVLDGRPAVFVQTQERLLERDDIELLDLLVVDEFYKLDPQRGSGRSRALNRALYKYSRVANQIYLIGPNIDDISISNLSGKAISFFNTDFNTVAIDLHDMSDLGEDEKPAALVRLLETKANMRQPTIVFTKSPAAALQAARLLYSTDLQFGDEIASDLADWMADLVHPDWAGAIALKHGIGLHHGRMPRSIAQLNVRLFNQRKIRLLICTSSLIEGVNTVAQNVVIYHNKIVNKKLDFFTFSNIKGRAGRMSKHFIGNVYLFDKPPAHEYEQIEIPIFQSDRAQELGYQYDVDPDSLSDTLRASVFRDIESTGFSPGILSRLVDYQVNSIEEFADELKDEIEKQESSKFHWSGYPKYDEILSLCNFAYEHMTFEKQGAFSGKQLAFFINKLRTKKSMRAFIDFFVEHPGTDEAAQEVEKAFYFLRGAEYTFPALFMLVHDCLNELAPGFCDYSVFVTGLENWFFSTHLKDLEEFGVPFFMNDQLTELAEVDGIDDAMARLKRLLDSDQFVSRIGPMGEFALRAAFEELF